MVRAKLALRNIEGNLCFTDHEAWAWFVLPTQPWAFRSDTQREQLLYGAGDALAWLAGHRLICGSPPGPTRPPSGPGGSTSGPPHPLKPQDGGSWADHLVAMQQHLRHQTMAEKKVFLGVRLAYRARATGSLARSGADPGNIEHARLLSPGRAGDRDRRRSRAWRAGPRPSAEMEWLLRRSVGLGLPAPASLSPAGSSDAGIPTTCTRFTDEVDYTLSHRSAGRCR